MYREIIKVRKLFKGNKIHLTVCTDTPGEKRKNRRAFVLSCSENRYLIEYQYFIKFYFALK